MSKNLTRKGLAFGALVALAGSVFAGTPAAADASSPVSLLPKTGTTFNSILQSGITLVAGLDPAYNVDMGSGVLTDTELKFIINNPAAATITIDPSATAEYWVFDSDGVSVPDNATGDLNDLAADTVAPTSAAVDETSGVLTTDATKIVVQADADGEILVKSSGTSNVTLTVQAFADKANNAAATGDTELNKINTFEPASKIETVVLYAPANVSAVTTITSATRASDAISAKVVYNNSINSTMVQADTKVVFYKDGSSFATDDATTAQDSAAGGNLYAAASASERTAANDYLAATSLDTDKVIVSTAYNAVNSGNPSTTENWYLTAGAYSARAVYTATTPDIYVGTASAISDLANGSNTSVTNVKSSLVEGSNVDYAEPADAAEAKIRTATKTVSVDAQIYASSAVLEASNVKVRAVVTGRTLGTGSSLSVSSASGTIAKAGETITAYAYTDTKGQVTFTVTSTTGAKDDAFDVVISVLKSDGTWVNDSNSGADLDVKWVDAALTTFTAKPGTYVSGATANVDFYAKDQFGVGIDSNTSGIFSVYAVALVAGVETPATYNATVSTVKGKASFSFKNFAAAGGSSQLKASLVIGGTKQTSAPSAPLVVNVYNSLATDKITIAESFESAITYADFVTGDTTDATVQAAVTKSGIASAAGATVSGTVLNINNAGQPGTPVVISGTGVLFVDGTNYAKDTITVYANEFGAFSVKAISHTVAPKGLKLSISADGKTSSTLLKTYLPTSLAADNLKFTLSVPALLVKNTTYAVVATLTDKWGNPVNANDTDETVGGTDFGVSFVGTGSVEINSSSTTLYKDFGKDGKVTVFLRSVKDIAGPGSINATLGSAFEYATTVDSTNTTAAAIVASISTNTATTAWDETLWSNSLTTDVEILEKKPTASISKGSKSSTVVVKNANGTTIKVVRGTKSKTVAADANTEKVTLKGGTGKVTVYVNGVKIASK